MWSFHVDGTVPDKRDWNWVFGSNTAGRHGKGAAKVASREFGARYWLGRGHVNRSYAIPTKDDNLVPLPLDLIKFEVDAFLSYARHMTRERWFVTRVGAGLAGHSDLVMARLFVGAPENCSFAIEWRSFMLDAAPWDDLGQG